MFLLKQFKFNIKLIQKYKNILKVFVFIAIII